MASDTLHGSAPSAALRVERTSQVAIRSTVVRALELDDLEAVVPLIRDAGWSIPTRADWERLWLLNPARSIEGPRPCRGWVLEQRGEIVGCLYNIEQLYQLGRRVIRAAVAASLVVAPGHRGRTMQLLLAFSRQSDVDLLLNTTASPQAQKLFEFAKFQRAPQSDYDRSLCWVLRPGGFVRAALRKRGLGARSSAAATAALAPALWAWRQRLARTHRSVDSTLRVSAVDVASVGSEFDQLWSRKRAEEARLLAYRTSADLRWHFGHRRADGVKAPFFVCAYDGSQLLGYTVVVHQDSAAFGLKRARIADLLVLEDDPSTTRQLLHAALYHAHRRGAEMLELIGFPRAVRSACRFGSPFEFQREGWPILYEATDASLRSALASEATWYASLYDGDGAL